MNELNNFLEEFKLIAEIPEETLTDEALKAMLDNLNESFSQTMVNQAIAEILHNLEDQNATRADAIEAINALKEFLDGTLYGEQVYTGNKKILIDTIANTLYGVFDQALEKYHMYAIELPMTVAPGAKVPTYAHDTDAAADLYALETTVIEGNRLGTKIRTGINIQLPEGWLALVLPRSSMGTKTPLRLSNSVGLIDSGYRGEIMALYDNISDSPYTINAGDRIAQLLVMPNYRFQANVVDALTESDRGEGGFGSSGT